MILLTLWKETLKGISITITTTCTLFPHFFVFKQLMRTIIFDSGPVLSESAAARTRNSCYIALAKATRLHLQNQWFYHRNAHLFHAQQKQNKTHQINVLCLSAVPKYTNSGLVEITP